MLFDEKTDIDMSSNRKLAFKWLGPYRVKEATPRSGTYNLEDLHGARLRGTFAGNRLKRFHTRGDILDHPNEGERALSMAQSIELEGDSSDGEESVEDDEQDTEVGAEPPRAEDISIRVIIPPVSDLMRAEYREVVLK